MRARGIMMDRILLLRGGMGGETRSSGRDGNGGLLEINPLLLNLRSLSAVVMLAALSLHVTMAPQISESLPAMCNPQWTSPDTSPPARYHPQSASCPIAVPCFLATRHMHVGG